MQKIDRNALVKESLAGGCAKNSSRSAASTTINIYITTK